MISGRKYIAKYLAKAAGMRKLAGYPDQAPNRSHWIACAKSLIKEAAFQRRRPANRLP